MPINLAIEVKVINGPETVEFFKSLDTKLKEQQEPLFHSLGAALVDNVKRRIITSDGGKWAPGSKWLKAKSGQPKVLLGAEKYVKYKITAAGLQIVGKTGKWTLTDHHEGFTNALADASEPRDDAGRVVLTIKDAAPLHLYQEFRQKRDGSKIGIKTTFAFVPKEPGKTPARKIWPNEEEALAIVEPLASRWLNKIVEENLP